MLEKLSFNTASSSLRGNVWRLKKDVGANCPFSYDHHMNRSVNYVGFKLLHWKQRRSRVWGSYSALEKDINGWRSWRQSHLRGLRFLQPGDFSSFSCSVLVKTQIAGPLTQSLLSRSEGSGAWELAHLTSSQVRCLLLVCVSHSKNRYFQISYSPLPPPQISLIFPWRSEDLHTNIQFHLQSQPLLGCDSPISLWWIDISNWMKFWQFRLLDLGNVLSNPSSIPSSHILVNHVPLFLMLSRFKSFPPVLLPLSLCFWFTWLS